MQLLPGVTPSIPPLKSGSRYDEQRAGPRHLLRIDQLFAAAELAGRDVVLDIRDDHRNDGERLRDAGDLGDHSALHDLRLDLPKAGLQASLPRAFRNQDPGRTHQRIDDVADPQDELLHAPAHAGADDGLVQLHLCLAERCFGAGLFGREHGGNPRLDTLFCGGGGATRPLALTRT